MQNNKFSPKEFQKRLFVLFMGLLFGQIGLLGIAYVMYTQNGALMPEDPVMNNMLTTIMYLIALSMIPLGYYFHSKKLKDIVPIQDMDIRLAKYKQSYLIKLLLFEMVSSFSILVYLLGGNYQALLISAIVLVVFFLNRPTSFLLRSELEIEDEDFFDREV